MCASNYKQLSGWDLMQAFSVWRQVALVLMSRGRTRTCSSGKNTRPLRIPRSVTGFGKFFDMIVEKSLMGWVESSNAAFGCATFSINARIYSPKPLLVSGLPAVSYGTPDWSKGKEYVWKKELFEKRSSFRPTGCDKAKDRSLKNDPQDFFKQVLPF